MARMGNPTTLLPAAFWVAFEAFVGSMLKTAGKIEENPDFPRLFVLKLGIAILIPIPICLKVGEAIPIPIPTRPDPT